MMKLFVCVGGGGVCICSKYTLKDCYRKAFKFKKK